MKINLPVPYFSQMDNTYNWSRDIDPEKPGVRATNSYSCNITCITMMMHYYGMTELTPNEILPLLDKSGSELYNFVKSNFEKLYYPSNLIKIADRYCKHRYGTSYENDSPDRVASVDEEDSITGRLKSRIDLVIENLQEGHPCMVSASFTDAEKEGSGHFVVVRGYDSENRTFFINDPYGNPCIPGSKNLNLDYKKGEFVICDYGSTRNEYGKPPHGENVEVTIESLKKIMHPIIINKRDEPTFQSVTSLRGPVPNKVAFPFSEDDKLTCTGSIQWYANTELAKRGGYFPIGSNNSFHSGGHLFSNRHTQKVRAMAPRYVVAFRFYNRRLETKTSLDSLGLYHAKTTSFVMLRHEIEIPKPNSRTGEWGNKRNIEKQIA